MKKITPKTHTKPDFNPSKSTKKLSENEIKYTKFQLIAVVIFAILAISRAFDDVVEYDPDGKPVLKAERKDKMIKEIMRMEECEQYALRASSSGWFLCESCVDTTYVFLNKGEVYRYGERCDKNDSRHSKSKLDAQNLFIDVQIRGNKIEYYQEQQRKIYFYPLLPENLKRTKKLGHPPGNKQDN